MLLLLLRSRRGRGLGVNRRRRRGLSVNWSEWRGLRAVRVFGKRRFRRKLRGLRVNWRRWRSLGVNRRKWRGLRAVRVVGKRRFRRIWVPDWGIWRGRIWVDTRRYRRFRRWGFRLLRFFFDLGIHHCSSTFSVWFQRSQTDQVVMTSSFSFSVWFYRGVVLLKKKYCK